LTTAERIAMEREKERIAGDTFYWSEIEKLITDIIRVPVGQFLTNIPTTQDVLANPHDPSLARGALE